MKKHITHQTVITATCLLCACGSSLAAEDNTHPQRDHQTDERTHDHTCLDNDRYQAHEFSVDLFGSTSLGQTTLKNLSGENIEHDARVGAGAGLNYFFTRNLGVGVDAYTENAGHSFVDSVSANLLVRFPIGNSGFAPYVLGGGGRQFDPIELWYGQGGGGVEYRFTRNVGLFTDGRYVFTEGTPNYGLFRLGVRVAF